MSLAAPTEAEMRVICDDLNLSDALCEWYESEKRARRTRGGSCWANPTDKVVLAVLQAILSARESPPARDQGAVCPRHGIGFACPVCVAEANASQPAPLHAINDAADASQERCASATKPDSAASPLHAAQQHRPECEKQWSKPGVRCDCDQGEVAALREALLAEIAKIWQQEKAAGLTEFGQGRNEGLLVFANKMQVAIEDLFAQLEPPEGKWQPKKL